MLLHEPLFMWFNKHMYLCLLVISCGAFRSQTCSLVMRGTVRDQDNAEKLGFAVVKLLAPEKIVTTDENGEFVLEGLCAGNYQLLVKHIGCHDTVFEVELRKSRRVILKLPHSVNELTEVDVMDKRAEMKKTQTVSRLSAEELQKTKGQSLGEVLKQVSGVTALNTGATISKPMIHGMQGYRLLILNNGIRQEGQQWGNEHAPEIDPFTAKKISVIKGVGAIRYGSDAIAGVVLVEPDDLPDTAAVTGEINLAGFSNGRTGAASAQLQGYFDRVKYISWRVQGSMKKGGSIKTPGYYLDNTGTEEKNFSYALGYHRKKWGLELYYSQFNAEVGIFKGSHIGNLSDLQQALAYGKPIDSTASFSYAIDRPRQSVGHELVKGLAHYHFSPRWRAKVQYAWQYNLRQEYDLRRLTNTEKETQVVAPDLDLHITSQTTEAVVEHDNIRSFRGMAGLSYMHQGNVYKGRFFIPNYVNNTWGVFATERYVLPKAEIEIGARYDEKKLQSFFYEGPVWTGHERSFRNVTYNGGLIWKGDSSFNVFVNLGSAWRAPAPNELYSNGIHQGVGSIERGQANLQTETCYNLTATGIYRRNRWHVELTLYHNQFRNFIYLNPSGAFELTIRGAFPVFDYVQANARVSGADLKAEYGINKYISVLAKGMVVRAWNYSIDDYLVYMPGDRGEISVTLKLPESKPFSGTSIQLSNVLVAKQWRVPANTDYAPPPPAYYLLGIELGTRLNFGRQAVLINLGVTNLLNARYREYLDRFRYYCDAQGQSFNVRLTVPLMLYDKK
jgi:iron complex outermembrane receptor protein